MLASWRPRRREPGRDPDRPGRADRRLYDEGRVALRLSPGLHPPKLLNQGRTRISRSLGAGGDFMVANLPNVAIAKGPMTGEGGPSDARQPPEARVVPRGGHAASGGGQPCRRDRCQMASPCSASWVAGVKAVAGGAGPRASRRRRPALQARSVTLTGQISLGDQPPRRLVCASGTPDIWVTAYRYVQNQNPTSYGGSRDGDRLRRRRRRSTRTSRRAKPARSPRVGCAFNPGRTSRISGCPRVGAAGPHHGPASLWDRLPPEQRCSRSPANEWRSC